MMTAVSQLQKIKRIDGLITYETNAIIYVTTYINRQMKWRIKKLIISLAKHLAIFCNDYLYR